MEKKTYNLGDNYLEPIFSIQHKGKTFDIRVFLLEHSTVVKFNEIDKTSWQREVQSPISPIKLNEIINEELLAYIG